MTKLTDQEQIVMRASATGRNGHCTPEEEEWVRQWFEATRADAELPAEHRIKRRQAELMP